MTKPLLIDSQDDDQSIAVQQNCTEPKTTEIRIFFAETEMNETPNFAAIFSFLHLLTFFVDFGVFLVRFVSTCRRGESKHKQNWTTMIHTHTHTHVHTWNGFTMGRLFNSTWNALETCGCFYQNSFQLQNSILRRERERQIIPGIYRQNFGQGPGPCADIYRAKNVFVFFFLNFNF
jgi:hypothetical protein